LRVANDFRGYNAPMGFVRGFLAPFRGAVYVTRARLWHMVIVPLLLNVALAGGAALVTERYLQPELPERVMGSTALGTLLLVILTALATIILFLVLQPLLGAIFNDFLCERVEKRVGGEPPKVRLLTSVGQALSHGILKLVLYGLGFVISLALWTVTAGLSTAVGLALAGLFLAYDGFDFPLSRRGATFGAKWRYLALHPAQTIGYGLGATVFYLIPLALIVAPSMTAVGATLVFLETESRAIKKTQAKGKVQVDEASPLRDGQG
jgi:uncharacterized protein involved in cysteine biosynthesis